MPSPAGRTDLDAALADPNDQIFFDAGTTLMRAELIGRALDAGKHVYARSRSRRSEDGGQAGAEGARLPGSSMGSCRTSCSCRGLRKLALLRDSGFFGNILSVRGEFGYWVFEGDWGVPAQRPSWNYRKKDGGGIILDMLCHWRYVLDNLFGEVKAVSCLGATHIPSRIDEQGRAYDVRHRRRGLCHLRTRRRIVAHINSSWAVRVRRDDLVTFRSTEPMVPLSPDSRNAGRQHRVNTPKPVWNPDQPQTIDFYRTWDEVPDTQAFDNGFKAQWEMFLRHVAESALP
ncbi:gfo/Idh/MocA family oxidoreductase [Sinorhizobium meliloti]|nr:gfo/Idh/MocA family oxidoreductase [Sinorhizobium meliloti]